MGVEHALHHPQGVRQREPVDRYPAQAAGMRADGARQLAVADRRRTSTQVSNARTVSSTSGTVSRAASDSSARNVGASASPGSSGPNPSTSGWFMRSIH